MDEVIEQMKAVYQIMSDRELAKAIASMYRNLYEEMIAAGFSQEQAMNIVSKFELKK